LKIREIYEVSMEIAGSPLRSLSVIVFMTVEQGRNILEQNNSSEAKEQVLLLLLRRIASPMDRGRKME